MTTIRPADASRSDEIIALGLARLPQATRNELAWMFESPEMFSYQVIEEAVGPRGQLLGYGAVARPAFAPEDRAYVRVVVARAHERRGVGGALFRSLMGQLPPGTVHVGAGVFDDDAASLDIAKGWGFEVEEHSIYSRLELGAAPELVSEPGLPEGVTLEESDDLVFADRDAVEHMLLVSQTNPEALAGWAFDLDAFKGMQGRDLPVCVVARVDGRPAGITYGTVRDDTLVIVYSGIDPQFRGRGLMRLVKEQAHVVAVRKGATVSKTANEENNRGIRCINAQLGYVVTAGTYRLIRHLAP